MKRLKYLALALGLALGIFASAQAPAKKPNILVIFGDDIGMWNVGAYTHGMMGHTPNIDSLAKQGALFTDHYGATELHCGPGGVHHGSNADSHRHDDDRHSRFNARNSEGRSDARRSAQVARLRHGPVREEPPRRPQ